MTRIDFHSNVPDKIAYTCRLTRKARVAGSRLVLLVNDRQELMTLDQALWTFSEQEFLPHVTAGDPLAAQTPVILTDRDDAELPHYHVLVNLTASTPAHFARFERMIEIISSDETEKAAGRERFRFYKQRGYPLTHFEADKA
ncbi:DNA polymerase III subunit chi [Noviherbaspirillum denitrificans]|uniref:DNA polymerase III subunit chi n=1 Tax=Noviherbaspirillum denitrificans TaxID=1968433 RepID=A0A254TJJ6_9BURK|nr:DNA polymerase III subunit chi [Noviherbaspirillum denitrificans]OWW22801.1 DNA polymerase III subunit chi [Noviherbaspirillum denitrificans]